MFVFIGSKYKSGTVWIMASEIYMVAQFLFHFSKSATNNQEYFSGPKRS